LAWLKETRKYRFLSDNNGFTGSSSIGTWHFTAAIRSARAPTLIALQGLVKDMSRTSQFARQAHAQPGGRWECEALPEMKRLAKIAIDAAGGGFALRGRGGSAYSTYDIMRPALRIP
jgi:hypothetical protein